LKLRCSPPDGRSRIIQIAQLFDEHVRPSAAEVRAQLAALSRRLRNPRH
jgi:hypothetical protein